MKINQFELFHGAVLAKIIRNKKNRIGLIDFPQKAKWALYRVETQQSKEKHLLIKHDATPEKRKTANPKELSWYFSLQYSKNVHVVALVCMETKNMNRKNANSMTLCYLSEKDLDELILPEERVKGKIIRFTVSLKPGQKFRVYRKQKNIKFNVSRNAIEKL